MTITSPSIVSCITFGLFTRNRLVTQSPPLCNLSPHAQYARKSTQCLPSCTSRLLVVGGGRTEPLGVVLWDEPDRAPRLRDVPEAPSVVRDAVVDTEAQVLRRLERTLAEPNQVSMR